MATGPILRMSSTHTASSVLLRSKMFIPTQRMSQGKGNQQGVAASSELLEKGGFIRRTGAGLYAWMPAGQRVLERLTELIDIHMRRVEGQKLQMPALTPATLWKSTKRWDTIGDELIRVRDRAGQDYCLGPTHEEAFTDVVASMSVSTKALPLRLYQISPKYRDELRPRGALMRAREFLMKDMYSFDATYDDAMVSYDKVFAQYLKFFADISLPVVPVRASGGSMGGSYTHEFQVLNEAGEDTVATCSCGKVACNIEVADRRIPQDRAHRITWDRLCDQIEGLVDLKPYKQAQQITAWWNECPRRDTEGETQIDFHHVVLKCTTREKKKESVHYEDLFVFKSTGRALNEDRLDRLLGADVQLLSPASAKEQKLPITSARFYFDWSIHDVVQVDESHVAPEEQSSTDSSEVSSLPSHSYWGDLTEIVPGDCCNEASCPQQNQGRNAYGNTGALRKLIGCA